MNLKSLAATVSLGALILAGHGIWADSQSHTHTLTGKAAFTDYSQEKLGAWRNSPWPNTQLPPWTTARTAQRT
jgi:hypothetical protein